MWSNIITILFMSGCTNISESVVYWLQRSVKSFEDSRKSCTWSFDGLAEVYNTNQQQYLSFIAKGNEVWIGISKCQQNWCYAGSGRWVSYTNWAEGEPNNHYSFFLGEENCVLMLSSLKWNDESCSGENYFVCQQLQCEATTCNRKGSCVELANGFSCTCDQGFYGNNCENVQCKATTCNRRGRCIELANGFRCTCGQGFYGNNCENVQCKATTCNRRGRCIDLVNGFSCSCDQGFYGNNCENVQCKATTCNRRGRCIELANGFRCTCDQGFYGNNCENVQCKVTTCNRRGRCIELASGFSCTCNQGFYGNNCENVQCKATTCSRRGACSELANGFSCTCDQGFYGNNCENVQCKATTCSRRGACSELANGFSCTCDQGFYGNNCENVTSCPVITKANHSTVKCEGSHGKNHFQSVCTFTCDQGFILNGNNSATCQAFGSWTTYITICQGTVNHLKLSLIIVTMGAAALLVLSVICWWKRRNRQEQNNTSNDLPLQQKMSAYESHSIYVLPTPCLNNETPQDEIYNNCPSIQENIYANLE